MSEEKVDSFLPLFGRDFLASTMGWTAEERGHYMVLLITQWEQGSIPPDVERLELVSAGVSRCWPTLEPKFPIDGDGRRRNVRCEEHRATCLGLKAARSEAGKAGARRRWQTDGKANGNRIVLPMASGMANGMAKRWPPTPTPTPTPEISNQTPAGSVATSEPPKRRTRSLPPDAIAWTAEAGWQGIEDADRTAWREAYPACDLAVELAKANEWLRANPTKARKSSWRRFLVAWLTRSQDRGGTHRQPAGQPAPRPVDPARRSWFRGDANASMTDAQYAAWRASRSVSAPRPDAPPQEPQDAP